MLQIIETINTAVNNFIWGVPAMVCIFGVGLYLSIRTNFLQIRKFPYAIKTTLGRIFRKRDAVSYTHLDVYKRQGETYRKVGRTDCGNDFSDALQYSEN